MLPGGDEVPLSIALIPEGVNFAADQELIGS